MSYFISVGRNGLCERFGRESYARAQLGAKILENCAPDQRSMFTLEGFAVKDHAHLVYYAGERGQGIDRYTRSCLGDVAVQNTIDAITFSPDEMNDLDVRLDRIR